MLFTHKCLYPILALLGQRRASLAYGNALARRDDHVSAVAQFARAARAGLREAQYQLGRCYLNGQGVPPSLPNALCWLTRAAEAGEPAAQAELASLALRGVTAQGFVPLFDGSRTQTGQPDFHHAAYWGRRAAAGGSAEAKALLGLILTAGPAALRDVPAGEAYYRASADAGSVLGQFGLAIKLLERGDREAARQALPLLQKAGSAGVPMAHYVLGLLTEAAPHGRADLQAATAAYKASAELGFAPAQLRYGLALLAGRGTPVDSFAAETWLRKAAMAGEAEAAAAVGDLYAKPGDVPPNYAEAAIWYGRAAEAGHAASARMLGRFYLYGHGHFPDIPEAVRWLRRAIQGGDEPAYDDMARLALTRRVSQADQQACLSWFQRQAEAGVPAAQYNLGVCLAEGIGTERDDAAAMRWFTAAADTVPIAHVCIQVLRARASQADAPAVAG
jgi:TPR repeat protein